MFGANIRALRVRFTVRFFVMIFKKMHCQKFVCTRIENKGVNKREEKRRN